MEKNGKVHNLPMKKRIIVIIAAALVAVIALSVVLAIFLGKEDEPARPESLKIRHLSMEYSFVDVMLFNNKINGALRENFYISDKKNFISSRLLLAFSEARIPADKLQNFGDYFYDFCKMLKDNGVTLVDGTIQQAPTGGNNEAFSGFAERIKHFFEKTELSEVETAKVLYHLLKTNSGSEEFSAVLDTLGQNNFITITANTVSAVKLSLENSGGLTEARMVQTLLTALGSNYLEIEALIGYSGIEVLLGLNYNLDEIYTNLPADSVVDVYLDTINSGKNLIANIIYFGASLLENSEVAMLEKIYEYREMENKESFEAKRVFAESRILLAKSITHGLEKTFEKSALTDITDTEGFIEAYSEFFAKSRKANAMFYGADEDDYEEYKEATETLLTDFFGAAYRLSQLENTVTASEEEFDDIYLDAMIIETYKDVIGKPLESVLTVVYINGMLKLVTLQDKILENFTYIGN